MRVGRVRGGGLGLLQVLIAEAQRGDLLCIAEQPSLRSLLLRQSAGGSRGLIRKEINYGFGFYTAASWCRCLQGKSATATDAH